MKKNDNTDLRKICVCSIMIALGTVLSLFKIEGVWLLGGGITICSMLPLIITSYLYGTKWGIISSFVFSMIQIVLGIDNIQYATSIFMGIGIILLDYVFAYSVFGLSAVFKNTFKKKNIGLILGIVFSFSLRLFFHFLSGWLIWDKLWPNKLAMLAPVYSLSYNASYLVPEAVITSVAAVIVIRLFERKGNKRN